MDKNKKLFISCLYIFFVNGALALILGAIIPYIRETCSIDYKLAGLMISMHSIGNLISSFVAGVLPIYLGRKNSILLLVSTGIIAFGLMFFSKNPFLLVLAFFLTGITRGSISNFCNTLMNEISEGKAWALNILHGVFAVGAFTAPFIAMLFTKSNPENWKYAALTIGILSVTEFLLLIFMKLPSNTVSNNKNSSLSLEFLKDKNFLTACAILFFYLSAEQGVNGWLVTYFKDTGIMSGNIAQSMASLLWMIILVGRLVCAYLSNKVKKSKVLLINSFGYVIFFVILLSARQIGFACAGIIGIGFFMAGLYPTTISSISDITKKYPLALSYILTCASLGAIITPSIVGFIADKAGIAGGMSVLVVTAIFTLLFIIINAFNRKKEA